MSRVLRAPLRRLLQRAVARPDAAGQVSLDNAEADLADVPPPASFPGVEADSMLGSTTGAAQRAAFTADWDEAHDQLAAGRYAEALALLSAWYNDADLAVEENQRLEDLLGQLAGTVIYSQKDLLMPPHVVGAGETLPAIAAPLGSELAAAGKDQRDSAAGGTDSR